MVPYAGISPIRLAYAIRSTGAENEKYKTPHTRGKSWASLFRVKFRNDNACVQTFRLNKLC
jgi:hypothetical protein